MSSRERMTKVLGCLVLSVTAGAIILKLLQPEPLTNVTAFSLSAAFTPIQQIFETRVPVDSSRWQSIVIHQTGSTTGSAQTIAQSSRKAGLNGLGYHFVINNGRGRGAPDGRIQVSQCWVEQKPEGNRPFSQSSILGRSAIRICLIGDFSTSGPSPTQMRQLQSLLRSIQQHCRIPSRKISLAGSMAAGTSQWRFFPLNELRESLLIDP